MKAAATSSIRHSSDRHGTEIIAMAVGAIIVWFGLGLQFGLMLSNHPNTSTGEAIVRFFSFFTILTNIIVALGFTFPLLIPRSAMGTFFAGAAARGATAVYIVTVGVTYSILLRHLYHLQGWAKLADMIVHDVVPLFYFGYWLLFALKYGLRWKDAAIWLIYPLAYLVYTLVRGAFYGWYPYPFIDVTTLGYKQVLINAAALTVAAFTLGLLVVAIARWSSGSATATQAAE
jgi:hypothetical protein